MHDPHLPPPPPPEDHPVDVELEHQADDDEALDDALAVGELVKVTYLDVTAGREVLRYAVVVEVAETGGGYDPTTGDRLPTDKGVRVAYLGEVTDPIPVDVDPDDESVRPDVVRVERVET